MATKIAYRTFGALLLFIALSVNLDQPFVPGRPLTNTAEAIIGRPLTPMSYAGVARRTTRRVMWGTTVAATTAVAATSAAEAASYASAPPPPGPAAAPSSAVPIGTVVTALPGACTPVAVGGVEYSDCAGVFYKAAFQGSNLVYVVVERPL